MCVVSVVIPVFNRINDLMIPVKSLLHQDFSDWELLLIDDGSTDGSAELCNQLALEHTNIRTFHQNNSGVSAARNNGIENAKGSYILFLDSDDWLEADTISKTVQRIQDDKSDIVAFAMQIDRYQGEEIHSTTALYGEDIKVSKKELGGLFVNLYQKDYLCSSCTKLFKKEIIDCFNLRFRTNLVMYEDFYFVMDYLDYVSEISISNHAYYHYRMNEDVVMINKRMTDNLLTNLDIVAHRIELFTSSLGEKNNPRICNIIFDFYNMYFYKLFVSPGQMSDRLENIKRTLGIKLFRDAEIGCRTTTKKGKFYLLLRFAVHYRISTLIYLLYRNRYKGIK